MRSNGIRMSDPSANYRLRAISHLKYELSIFVDINGFINILWNNSRAMGKNRALVVKDITHTAHSSLSELAKNVLLCFPGLDQISFTVNTGNPARNITESYALKTVYSTVGFHYKFKATNGHKVELVSDLTVDHILKRYNFYK